MQKLELTEQQLIDFKNQAIEKGIEKASEKIASSILKKFNTFFTKDKMYQEKVYELYRQKVLDLSNESFSNIVKELVNNSFSISDVVDDIVFREVIIKRIHQEIPKIQDSLYLKAAKDMVQCYVENESIESILNPDDMDKLHQKITNYILK